MTTTNTLHKLPNTVTHLDIIKTVAVILMIIDHIGFYFFEGYDWFRVFGRMGGAPVWLFLIGYAHTRDLPNKLLIGALVLVVADTVMFGSPFALNVLVTIIFLRLSIDHIMTFMLKTRYMFWMMNIILVLGFMATDSVFEYGSLAILYAMAGYLVRHKDQVIAESFFTRKDYIAFLVFVVGAFCILENARFGFSEVQFVFLAVMASATMYGFANMTPMTFDEIKDTRIRNFLMFCGRNTLEIYVGHLLLFKVIFLGILALK